MMSGEKICFQLRPWLESDVNYVAQYANNPKVAANLRNAFPSPYTLEDARAYVSSCVADGEARQCLRAIDINGEAVGSIGIFLSEDVYCRTAELGYWLAEPFWGQGIMSTAIREICAYVFSHYDVVRIYAEPFACNTGSRRVLEKNGFLLEGVLRNNVYKNGCTYDSCIYALLNE